jgi:hypothetical protein
VPHLQDDEALAMSDVSPNVNLPEPNQRGEASTRVSPSIGLPLPDIIAEIREQHRIREDFHRAEKRLTNQIKAIHRRVGAHSPSDTHSRSGPDSDEDGAGHGRRGTHKQIAGTDDNGRGDHENAETRSTDVATLAALPLTQCRDLLRWHRKNHEKRMEKLAKMLPVWPWWECTRGVGALALAQIIGEAGDLSGYPNPAKLWKRMCLAVVEGAAQKKVKGAGALKQGYSPRRRSVMYVIGDCLIRAGENPYKLVYDERKELEATKLPDGPKMKIHRRAHRYMEKRLLRDLWREWRRCAATRRLSSSCSMRHTESAET